MATRGTYLIDGVRMYNHWDNYPEGAARMVAFTLQKHSKFHLFNFIRANERVERIAITGDSMGAEYHYEITESTVKAYAIDWDNDTHEESFRCIFTGSIDDFLAQYLGKMEDEDEDDLTFVVRNQSYYTINQVKAEIEKEWKAALHALENGWIGNSSGMFSTCFEWLNLLGSKGHDILWFQSKFNMYRDIYAPTFARKFKHDGIEVFMRNTPEVFN